MDYEKLTAQQALELATVREELAERKQAMDEISLILCCIGGPLNDNKLGYTSEQLKPLRRINNLAEF